MALDAVVGVVEGAGEVCAGVCELEAFTVTPVFGGELELDQAVGFDSGGGNEVFHIQLMRSFEEDSGAVFRFAGGGEGGPGGVLGGEEKSGGVGSFGVFGRSPLGDVRGEAEFGEGFEEEGFEVSGDGDAVNERGLSGVWPVRAFR